VGLLDEAVAALALGRNLASVTTLSAAGAPVATLMWIDADADHLLVNTERHRLKYRNLARDPRVHVLIIDDGDAGRYAAVQGVVSEAFFGEAAREHIDHLARKYQGSDFDPTRIVSERVLLKIRPLKQHVRDPNVRRE
jgi:PPOX class probable F420-dependent enzyme